MVSGRTMSRWRVGRLLAAAGGVALLVACGSGDAPDTESTAPTIVTPRPAGASPTARAATPTPSPTPRAVRTPTPLPTPAPVIGDVVEVDDWQLSVTSIDTFERVGDSTAAGSFLYVRLQVTNGGDGARAFPFDGLVVLDIEEQTYFYAEAATNETLTFDFGIDPAATIAPGESRALAVVFDIPDSSTGLVLTTPSRAFAIQLRYPDAVK